MELDRSLKIIYLLKELRVNTKCIIIYIKILELKKNLSSNIFCFNILWILLKQSFRILKNNKTIVIVTIDSPSLALHVFNNSFAPLLFLSSNTHRIFCL